MLFSRLSTPYEARHGCLAWNAVPTTTHLRIINKMEDHMDIKVHCRSKEDDIGEHMVKYGDYYQIVFRPTFLIKATLFVCVALSSKGHIKWEAFKQVRDDDTYGDVCIWTASNKGMISGEGFRDLTFDWQPYAT